MPTRVGAGDEAGYVSGGCGLGNARLGVCGFHWSGGVSNSFIATEPMNPSVCMDSTSLARGFGSRGTCFILYYFAEKMKFSVPIVDRAVDSRFLFC